MNIYFSSNLKYLRKKLNISQKEISNKLNKGITAISAWESGQAHPNALGLIGLSEILKIPIDDLLKKDISASGVNEPSPEYHKPTAALSVHDGSERNEEIIAAYERMAERHEKEIDRLMKQVDRLLEDKKMYIADIEGLQNKIQALERENEQLKERNAG